MEAGSGGQGRWTEDIEQGAPRPWPFGVLTSRRPTPLGHAQICQLTLPVVVRVRVQAREPEHQHHRHSHDPHHRASTRLIELTLPEPP
jgi:hypothetical protein